MIGAMILATTLITMEIENADRRRTEAQRLSDNHALAVRLASRAAGLSQPTNLIALVSEPPWSLTDPAADERTLTSLLGPEFTGPDSLVALVDATGRPLVTRPSGAAVPIPPNSKVWDWARENGLEVPVYDQSSTIRLLTIVPIRRAGSNVAFLVLGRMLAGTPLNELANALKVAPDTKAPPQPRLGLTITIVQWQGRVTMSSDATLIGQLLVDPAELRAIRPGSSQRVTLNESHGSGSIAAAAMIPTVPMPAYLILQQNTRVTSPEPQASHLLSDLLLAATVFVTAAGLLWTLLREDQAIRREGARLHTLLHESHDIIICLNRAGRPTFISSAIEGLLGHRVVDWIGQPLFDLIHPQDQGTMRDFVAERRHGVRASLLDVRMRTTDGDYRWFDIEAGTAQSIHGPGHLDAGVLLTCHEVGRRRQLQEELWQRATRDPLTGLPNRVALAHQLDGLARDRSPFTILLIDLDDFKPVNDTFGHHAGDDVLRSIASRLTGIVRTRSDRPPHRAVEPAGDTTGGVFRPGGVFRLGGDEFVMVLPDIDADSLRETARRVREAIADPVIVAGRTIVVRAAVGLASSRSVGDEDGIGPHPDAVVRHADADMYEAKRAARAARTMFPAAR
jgi:PAS domain S-box-containing protein